MLCSKNSCTGCLSCQNICPKNAIQVITDKQGFWQPQIDNEKCINCGLCHKSCPVYFKPHNEENLTEKSMLAGIKIRKSVNRQLQEDYLPL